MREIPRKSLTFVPYKISHNEQFLLTDTDGRLFFVLTFLVRVEFYDFWRSNIHWRDQAHFYLNKTMTHECLSSAIENPPFITSTQYLYIPQSYHLVCFDFTQFTLRPFFFEEHGDVGCVILLILDLVMALYAQNIVRTAISAIISHGVYHFPEFSLSIY